MQKTINHEQLIRHEPLERFAKQCKVSPNWIKEIYRLLETDFTLGYRKYTKLSRRLEIYQIYISKRKLRYIHKVLKEWNIMHESTKRGGKIVGTLKTRLYSKS